LNIVKKNRENIRTKEQEEEEQEKGRAHEQIIERVISLYCKFKINSVL
jgi:hypothetical protein